jgi:glycosyltransferase involved in cell wall biosynthesis
MGTPAPGLVVIPAYNEAKQIGQVIEEVRRHAPELDLLVVDDCSTDRTRTTAVKAGARVVSHPINLGDGAARQTGFKFAHRWGYRRVVTVDGDGQHDPRSIPALLAPIDHGEADLVVGTRFRPNKHGEHYIAAWDRRLGMYLFAKLASLLTRQQITDTTSGFRAMNERAINLFSSSWFPQTFPDADLLVIAHRAGLRIQEVPAVFREDPSGHSIHSGVTPIYYVFKMCLSLFVTMLRRAPRPEEVESHGS